MMTEQTNEKRAPNNVLTAAEMFRLTSVIRDRAARLCPSFVSWRAAEAALSNLLERPVTRPNILTALSALDDVSQSQLVKPRGPEKPAGDLDGRFDKLAELVDFLIVSKCEAVAELAARFDSIDERLGGISESIARRMITVDNAITRIDERVDSVENVARARVDAVIERVDFCEERLEAIDEVLAREAARIDEIKGDMIRLEDRLATFEKPFALNSGGDFAEGLPAK